ncbi:MAG TPA: metalloregulator ArsR/SmtB family transcription factor [Gaiellaceae bacterium]
MEDAEMIVEHPLPDDLVELIAQRFRALGEPTRIKLLDRLRDGEASVNELTELIGMSQQNVSKHLGVLHQAGVVGRRRRGNYVYYSIVDAGVFDLCESVCGSLREQLESLRLVVGASR